MIIRKQRIERAVKAVCEQQADMWISYAREMDYSKDAFLSSILTMDVFGPIAVIITSTGEKIAIIGRVEIEEVESLGIFSRVILNTNGIKSHIAEVIREVKPKTIALNYSDKDYTADGLSLTGYRLLTEAFQDAGFDGDIISSEKMMKFVRGNKSPEEVEKIRFAVQAAMKIFDEARPLIKQGMSGMEIQQLFQRLTDEKNYGYSWTKYGNPFNSIGTKTSYMCKQPSETVYIEQGDVVNVDFGITIDGFSSDNQRTFYALKNGESAPPDEVVKAFETLKEVNEAVVSHMKDETNSHELLAYVNEILVAAGYPKSNGGFGHEIGLYAHDGVLAPASEQCEPDISAVLLEGMTFAIEPSIITSYGRVCQEEVAVVTKSGGCFLSTPQKEIWLIT